MAPELAALAVHDLKNALGVLEAQLAALRHAADPALAAAAHDQCIGLRQRCVGLLTLYGAAGDGGDLRALCADESPTAVLDSLLRAVRPEGAAAARLGDCSRAPPFWFFDFRLVRMALEAALHNAWRFARAGIVLDVREDDGFLVFRIDDDGRGPGRGPEPGRAGVRARLDGASAAAAATGLGTALCEAVAQAHASAGRQGRVTLGERPGGGARFELWLA